jgi:F-type H+-transporting ATPase subunit a
MDHGITWLNFLPGYQQIEAYLQSTGVGLISGRPVLFQHVAAALLVGLILLLVGSRARTQLNAAEGGGVVPEAGISVRNIIEMFLEAVYGQMKSIIGPEASRYFPVIATLALYILICNLMGLIPGFLPPTDNWNTTFACAFFVFIYYNYHGLRVNGIHHIAHMANPVGETWGWFLAPLMFPIEIVSHIARPFSLGVRLATNMIGDHAVLGAFIGLVPILVPIPFLALGLLVCCVQTMVFVLLSIIYIALAVEEAHHDDHHHEGAGAHA